MSELMKSTERCDKTTWRRLLSLDLLAQCMLGIFSIHIPHVPAATWSALSQSHERWSRDWLSDMKNRPISFNIILHYLFWIVGSEGSSSGTLTSWSLCWFPSNSSEAGNSPTHSPHKEIFLPEQTEHVHRWAFLTFSWAQLAGSPASSPPHAKLS